MIGVEIQTVTQMPTARLLPMIYIYLGLGSYRLTIKERNGGVGIRGKNRMVNESTPCVANMNRKGFYDGETKLL